MIGNKLATTHCRIHGIDGFLVSMDFTCSPEIVIGALVKLQSQIRSDGVNND